MTTEAREYQQRLRAFDERTQALDELVTRSAGDLARVRAYWDALVEQQVAIDRIIAALHGGPLPPLTAGAQAILTRAAKERR